MAGLALLQDWLLLGVIVALAACGGILMAVASSGLPATLRDVLGAFVATGIGVLRSVRGDRFQTWNPPASARGMAGAREG
jgi:hypothetical protein